MKIKWGWAAAVVVGVGLAAAANDAGADQTANTRRTVAQCQGLAGLEPPADPAHPSPENLLHWCTVCVQRPAHHFHPLCPYGSRCNADNGQLACNKE